jgi:hypothetical protein
MTVPPVFPWVKAPKLMFWRVVTEICPGSVGKLSVGVWPKEIIETKLPSIANSGFIINRTVLIFLSVPLHSQLLKVVAVISKRSHFVCIVR